MTLVGDVTGKHAIIVDDIADTCGTLVMAAEKCVTEMALYNVTQKPPNPRLYDAGATEVTAIVTHGLFSRNALQKISSSKMTRMVVSFLGEWLAIFPSTHPPNPRLPQITNTCPHDEKALAACPKVEIIDVAPVFAEAIRRTHNGESVSYLFTHVPSV
jgi:ribose-phosphate pyrophosphokinase